MAREATFKYIHFARKNTDSGKAYWSCKNNKSSAELGIVYWYNPWKQYCIEFTPKSIFNVSCLADIQSFIKSLNNDAEQGG